MSQPVARIVKREYVDGQRYIAQRWVEKCFSSFRKESHYWQSFRMASGMCGVQFEMLSTLQERDSTWRDPSVAEFYCEEWTRYSQPDAVIKTWTKE